MFPRVHLMNVLVYNGPEVFPPSQAAVLAALRGLLLPHYAVQPIASTALRTQPWSSSCALLVLPRFSRPLQSPINTNIQDYVDRGGVLLAFGAGATRSTRGIMLGMESMTLGSQNTLKFFDRINNADVYPSLGTNTEDTAEPRVREIRTLDGDIIPAVYETAYREFTGFDGERGVKVLGRYIDDQDKVAGVGCDIGGGRIALWSPDLDVSLNQEPASDLISNKGVDPKTLDKARKKLLKRTMLYLGLPLPATLESTADSNTDIEDQTPIARPFPQFFVSTPGKPYIISRIIDALSESFEKRISDEEHRVLKDTNDIFNFHESTSINTQTLLQELKAVARVPSDPETWTPKHIIIYRNGDLPQKHDSGALFDVGYFFHCLQSARSSSTSTEANSSDDDQKWRMGDALFFSPAVTSTQTLLEKNYKLLTTLPTPILSIASHQLAGRGRGSNVWLSPSGCLQFSLHLRVKATDLPGNKLVFVQYLFALAVCAGIRDEKVLGDGVKSGENGGEGWRVRLKWPNDIYALVGPRGAEEKKKVGGILVNSSFGGGNIDIVIGTGINVLNQPPITSLVQLLRNTEHGAKRRAKLSLERTAACILARFEEIWERFLAGKGDFEPFLDDYLNKWLHMDQLVTLTTTTPPTQARIVGITLDHGLLRTVPERQKFANPYFTSSSTARNEKEEFIDLQPDGNSFDLMAGMIKTK